MRVKYQSGGVPDADFCHDVHLAAVGLTVAGSGHLIGGPLARDADKRSDEGATRCQTARTIRQPPNRRTRRRSQKPPR
jgi:hypothetical protein